MLQHDNAPSHSSFLVRDFLAKHATTVLPQPPYCPDLAPADFFCFQSSNQRSMAAVLSLLRRSRHSLAHLRSIPKTAFQECFRTLKKRWQRCRVERSILKPTRPNSFKVRLENFYCDIFGNFPDRPRISERSLL